MANKKDIEKTVIQIIEELINDQNLSFNERLELISLESIRIMAFISACEEEYDIEIDEYQINRDFFYDIKCLVNLIYNTIHEHE